MDAEHAKKLGWPLLDSQETEGLDREINKETGSENVTARRAP